MSDIDDAEPVTCLGSLDTPTATPGELPALLSQDFTDTFSKAAATANGAAQSPVVPNGKPSSPYVKESNPMGSGAAQTISSKDPKAAAAAASDMRNVVRRKLTGYVGFANLPNQWHRKSVRKGFSFNVMVVGKSGSTVVWNDI